MKEIMAHDSEHLCNLTKGVTHKKLSSYVFKFILLVLFYAFTIYAALCPPAHKFYEWLDNINPLLYAVFGFINFAWFGIWLIWFRRK